MSLAKKDEGRIGLLSDLHILLAFCIGVILVLLGFVVEVWLPPIAKAAANGWHMLLSEPPTAPAAPQQHAVQAHGLRLIDLLVLLCKERGVAFMVAAIIGWALEKQAKERDNERGMKLRADETLPVIISVRCVKELSDNEVWGSFYPTVEGITLCLSVLNSMRFGVRPLGSGEHEHLAEANRWVVVILTLPVRLFSGTLTARYRQIAKDREKGRIATAELINVTRMTLIFPSAVGSRTRRSAHVF